MLYFICPEPEQDNGCDKKGCENCKWKMVKWWDIRANQGNTIEVKQWNLPSLVRLKVIASVSSHLQEKLTEHTKYLWNGIPNFVFLDSIHSHKVWEYVFMDRVEVESCIRNHEIKMSE